MGLRAHAVGLSALLVVTAMAACNGNSAVIPKDEYEASGTVLEGPSHGPVLCLGPVLTSLPPKCGGPAVRNWDWAKVPARETHGGVTWAHVNLRGTWDGTAFTVTAVLDHPTTTDPPRHTPPAPACAAPEAVDPSAGVDDWGTGLDHDPDVAAVWVTYDPAAINVAVRPGAADRVRAEIRETYRGPLCVVERDQRPRRELRAIQHAVTERLGRDLLSVGVDELRGKVVARVVVADPALQAELDREHGAGVVELDGRITPVSRSRPPRDGGG